MGRNYYGVWAASLPNGGGFTTPESHRIQNSVVAAALLLETAVSTSLVAAVTGASGAGSMDLNIKSALSSSYSSLTASIF